MTEVRPSPVHQIPQLFVAEDLESPLPLEHTRIGVQITGPIARVTVSQRFSNPLKEPAELEYLFPLPEDSAITAFELSLGERRILGDLQEREAAQAAYEDARGQGKRAGLLDQRRDNLFAVRLANVQVGEIITASVRYQQRLRFSEGGAAGPGKGVYEFIYPMGLTPKYDSPEHAEEGQGVQAPIASGEERIGPVEIHLSLDAGLPVGEVSSPTHRLQTIRMDEQRLQISLDGAYIPDHDFVLRWQAAGQRVQAAGWTSGDAKQAFFLASLIPPVMDDDVSAPPREFVFVLDRSGSMSGEPIRQARNALRACLRALNVEDTFSILLFDNQLQWFNEKPVAVTQEQVAQADAFLDAVQGRGGTEIVRALQAALSLPNDPERARFVVFLTDGAVSAEARVLENLRKQIGPARLFTFGIGPSVNRALLNRMATLGRGRSEFLQLNEDIEGAIIRFQDSVSFPALTDLTLEWEQGKAWDIYPTRLPDLYYGQPLEVCGRLALNGNRPAKLTLRAQQGGHPVTVQMALPQPAGQDRAIERVWARARLDDLLEQMDLEPARAEKLRAEVIGLAIEYHLVTRFTSFAAVDRDPASPQGSKPRLIRVAQPLPQGVTFDQVGAGGQSGRLLRAMAAPSPLVHTAARQFIEDGGPVMPAPAASLMQQLASKRERQEGGAPVQGAAHPLEMLPQGGEAILRWLARSQNVNGSWREDVEWTAAAVMAFAAGGHTPRSGIYRQVMRRAVRWLVENSGQGAEAFLRARALADLASVSGDASDQVAAQAAREGLPVPSSDLERAALGQTVPAPDVLQTLDDLRMAVLLKVKRALPDGLFKGAQGELASVWSAALPQQ